jgi:lipopolysaccharide transport system permease protein
MRHWLFLNPLTLPVVQVRQVVIEGVLPAWRDLGISFAVGLMVAAIGLWLFERTRQGFADVV